MKNVILILFGILLGSPTFCQENKAHIKLGRYDVIVSKTFLPDKGVVLITGIPNQVGGKVIYDIHYFNADGTQAWTKPVTIEYGMNNSLTFTMVSPNGQTIYFIQMRDGGYYDRKHYISQFTINGTEKKFVVEGKEEFGKNLQTVFCDDNYLYYLATDDGNESNNKKKYSEKLLLNKFKSNDMSHQRISLDLPVIEDTGTSIYWSLIGQKGDEKFLAAKNIDVESGKNKFTIVSFDSQGKVGPQTILETSLANGKFTRPSDSRAKKSWQDNAVDHNYMVLVSRGIAAPNIPATPTAREIPTNGAFGHIFYSDLHDCFYLYGLFGPKPFRKVGPVYEGFYVQKFDRKGTPLWKLQEMGSKQLLDEGVFRVHGLPIERGLQVVPTQGNTLAASISFREMSFPFQISSDGVVTTLDTREDNNNLSTFYASGAKLKSLAYIDKTEAGKKVEYTALQNSSNELLIKFDTKGSTIDVLTFK